MATPPEMHRTLMRTDVIRDRWGFLRGRCLAHENCRDAGRMVEASGRQLDLFSQGREIWHLNENFKRHLQRRDLADGTSLALCWKVTDRIHGPQAPFPTPYGAVEPLPFCRDVDPAAVPEPARASAGSESGDAAASETEGEAESIAKRARCV